MHITYEYMYVVYEMHKLPLRSTSGPVGNHEIYILQIARLSSYPVPGHLGSITDELDPLEIRHFTSPTRPTPTWPYPRTGAGNLTSPKNGGDFTQRADFTPERGGTSPQNGGGLRQTFDYRKYYTKVLVKKTTKGIIFFKSSSFSRRNSNLHADNTDIFTRRSLM